MLICHPLIGQGTRGFKIVICVHEYLIPHISKWKWKSRARLDTFIKISAAEREG